MKKFYQVFVSSVVKDLFHPLKGRFNTFTKFGVFWVFFGIISQTTLSAQFSITYPSAAQPASVCLDPTTLTVRVDVVTAATTGTVTVDLPPGIEYIAGSVAQTGGTLSSISESNITNLNVPVFSLAGGGAIASGQWIQFTIQRQAPDCAARAYVLGGGIMKDVVIASSSAGTTTENDPTVNSYNLLYASFALTAPAAIINAQIGDMFNRSFTITNGGTGAASRVRFSITHTPVCSTSGSAAPATTNSLTVPGGTVTTVGTVGNTTYYEITGAALGGDNLFSNGESVVITENVTVGQCNPITNYQAGWGCGGAATGTGFWCQTATGSGSITMATGSAIPAATIAYPVDAATNQVSWCRNGVYNITYSNNGNGGKQGAMYNVKLNLGYNAGFLFTNLPNGTNGSRARIIGATINGNAVTYTTPTNAPWVADLAQLTSDPDGAGVGLEDLDGDGQYDDLLPGKLFVLQITEQWQCTAACPMSTYAFTPRTTVTFNNACTAACAASGAVTTTNQLFTANLYYIFHSPVVDITSLIPPQASCGTPFTLQFSYGTSIATPTYRPTDSLYLDITLPAGVGLSGTGNPTINGTAVAASNIEIIGNIVRIKRKGIPGTIIWTLDVVGNACDPAGSPTACGDKTFNVELSYTGDNSCSCRERWACASRIVNIKCPGPCPDGVTNYVPVLNRTTYGFTDATMTIPVNPNTLTTTSRQTVLPRDQFTLTATGEQFSANGDKNSLHYYYQLAKTSSGQEALTYISGTLTITLPGGGGTVVCTAPAPANNNTSTLQAWDWDLSSCNGGVFPVGSTYSLVLTFEVTDANNGALYGSSRKQPANTDSYFYNLEGANKLYCTNWATPILITGISRGQEFGVSTYNFSGCGRQNVAVTYRVVTAEPFDIFPNEFRPAVSVDQFKVTLPAGYILDPTGVVNVTTYQWNSLLVQTPRPAVNITGTVTQLGNVVTIPGTGWALSEIMFGSAYQASVGLPIIPSCAAVTGTTTASCISDVKDYFYANPNYKQQTNFLPVNGSFVYNATTKPAISLTNLTGSVQGIAPDHYWDVRISNPSTQTAPYVWLALPDNPSLSGIDVSQVEYPIGTPITPISYSGGKWYQISTAGLASGTNADIRVRFKYYDCSLTTLQAMAGWNCDGYPADPTAYSCGTSNATLTVDPQPSEVQLALTSQPAGAITPCTPFQYVLTINSAQAANLTNVQFGMNLPTGLAISGNFEAEYPKGSGNWAPMTNIGTASSPRFNLTTHPNYPTAGMPGTGTTSLVPPRQICVRFNVENNCSFSPGSVIDFSVYADRPCGGPATGNGVTVTSSAINLVGIVVPYITGNVNSAPSPILGCGNPQTISVTTTIVGGSTTPTDQILVSFPLGTEYAPGTYSCTGTTGGGLCPTVVGYNAVTRVLTLQIPSGIPAGGDFSYQFGIQGKGFSGCGSGKILRIQTTTTVAGYTCGMITCGPVTANTGSIDINVTIQKPTFGISNFTGTVQVPVSGATHAYTTQLTATNTSTVDLPSGSSVILEYFCLDAMGNVTGTPVATAVINGPLAAGAPVTVSATFSSNCSVTNGIGVLIQGVTDAAAPAPGTPNMEQCLCAATARVAAATLNCFAIDNGTPATQTICAGTSPVAVTFPTQNNTTNGIRFVSFASAAADPYTGGTSLGTATGNGTQVTLSAAMQPTAVGSYYIYAIQDPVPSDPACRPAGLTQLTITPTPVLNPIASVAVCPGNPVSVSFVGTPVSGVVYNWTNTNTNIGLGASGSGNISFTSNAAVSTVQTGTIVVTPVYTDPSTGNVCTGATQTFTITVNPTPSITLGANPQVCKGTTSASLTYSATTGSPDQYSIDFDAIANAAGFVDVTNAALSAGQITITVPAASAGNVYHAMLTVRNTTTGCVSTVSNFTITVNAITVVSATPSACALKKYDLSVVVSYGPGISGNIRVNTSNGKTALAVPTGSPQTIVLTGILADGATGIDVTAFFVSDPACADTKVDAYNAPAPCCGAPKCVSVNVIEN